MKIKKKFDYRMKTVLCIRKFPPRNYCIFCEAGRLTLLLGKLTSSREVQWIPNQLIDCLLLSLLTVIHLPCWTYCGIFSGEWKYRIPRNRHRVKPHVSIFIHRVFSFLGDQLLDWWFKVVTHYRASCYSQFSRASLASKFFCWT